MAKPKKRKLYKTHAELIRTCCSMGSLLIGISTFIIVLTSHT